VPIPTENIHLGDERAAAPQGKLPFQYKPGQFCF
jgi:hypothetical protein